MKAQLSLGFLVFCTSIEIRIANFKVIFFSINSQIMEDQGKKGDGSKSQKNSKSRSSKKGQKTVPVSNQHDTVKAIDQSAVAALTAKARKRFRMDQ